MRHSLRRRIFAISFAVSTGVSVLFGAFSLAILEGLEFEQIDLVLDAELDRFMKRHDEDGNSRPPRSSFIRSWLVALDQLQTLPEPLRALGPGHYELDSAGDVAGASGFAGDSELHEMRIAVGERDGWRYIVALDLSVTAVWENRVTGTLIVLLVACSLLGALVGRSLARRVADPVTRLAERVSGEAPAALSTPFASGQRDDEVGALARAMDSYVARLRDYARREHDFTGHVSHELRTPLAVAASAVELLLADTELGPAARRRLEGAERSLAGMHETLEALLVLARSEAGTGVEADVDIAAMLADVIEQCRPLLASRPVVIGLQVQTPASLRTLPGALRIVLRNLLANACAYTHAGEITVRLEDGRLTVSDTGPGISERDLPRLQVAGFRGSASSGDGEGLGLAIVQRLCERHGWRMHLESAIGGGTLATLNFAER